MLNYQLKYTNQELVGASWPYFSILKGYVFIASVTNCNILTDHGLNWRVYHRYHLASTSIIWKCFRFNIITGCFQQNSKNESYKNRTVRSFIRLSFVFPYSEKINILTKVNKCNERNFELFSKKLKTKSIFSQLNDRNASQYCPSDYKVVVYITQSLTRPCSRCFRCIRSLSFRKSFTQCKQRSVF